MILLVIGAIATHVAIDDPAVRMLPAIVVLVAASCLLWLRWTSTKLGVYTAADEPRKDLADMGSDPKAATP